MLRYDRAGCGRSPAADGPVDRVEELRAVADAACGARPFVLVGSSYGGQLAIDFALAQPQHVTGLVLIGPGLSGHRVSDRRRAVMSALAAAARRGGDALAELWLGDPHLCPHGFPAPIQRRVRDMLRDNVAVFASPPPSVAPAPALGRLAELAVRCRVFVGEHDDGDNLTMAERIGTEVPGATVEVVPGAGHFPLLERPGWLPHELAAFLARRIMA